MDRSWNSICEKCVEKSWHMFVAQRFAKGCVYQPKKFIPNIFLSSNSLLSGYMSLMCCCFLFGLFPYSPNVECFFWFVSYASLNFFERAMWSFLIA